jgi:hypothetical protein
VLTLSPQVGELLLQATPSQDLKEALQKGLRDDVERIKLAALAAESSRFEAKWKSPLPSVADIARPGPIAADQRATCQENCSLKNDD